jgi:quercetin dioxygenase-like cupin family protein
MSRPSYSVPRRRRSCAAAAVALAGVGVVAGCTSDSDWSSAAPTTTVAPGHDEATDVDAAHPHDEHITQIDGEDLPGEATYAKAQTTMIESSDGLGHTTVVHRTVRAPGTRAPIHTHDHAGSTCVLEGQMTLLLEGSEPAVAPAGTCYYMPPGKLMSGFNSGTIDAVMLDSFVVPDGEDVWTNVELD